MRNLSLCILSFIFSFSTLNAVEVEEITTLNQLAPVFEEANPNTLVIFDVDNVLTIPDHPAFQIANWAHHNDLVYGQYAQLAQVEKEALCTLMITQNPLLLIEESAPEWIANLSKRGIPVIALTAAWSENQLAWQRCETLRALGIELKGKESWGSKIVFNQCPCYNDSYPLYLNGVLFTNGQAVKKGELLELFFMANNYRPERICFIDDHRNYLESVGEVMERLGIPCDLYWYHGAKNFPSDAIDRDQMEQAWDVYITRAKQIAPQEIVR